MRYRSSTRPHKRTLLGLAPIQLWTSLGLSVVLMGAIVSVAALWPSKPGQADSNYYQSSREVIGSANLISRYHDSWMNLPGSSTTEEGLRIRPVPFAIVEQDGSPGQANPPVNLYGAHLRAEGDFKIHATLEELKNRATLSLYGQVPIIYDEFRYERATLQLSFEEGQMRIQTWKDNKAGEVASFAIEGNPQAQKLKLDIAREDGLIRFSINGKSVGEIPESGLFASGEIWFGASAETSDWLLSSLRAERSGGADLQIVNTSSLNMWSSRWRAQPGLQRLIKDKRPDFTIGAAVALAPLVSDRDYARVALGNNFGSLTTENALKWQFVHPAESTYDFRETDALVELAERHKIKVHGHTLVFGEANPAWVQALPIATQEDKQRVEKVMLDHIAKVAGRYSDKVATWDVINEPLADYDTFMPGTGELRDHIWYQAMGEAYIAKAFHAAQAAVPKAKLFINEYGLEEDGERWDAFLTLVTRLKQQGVPIDGVGFQAHVYEQADKILPQILQEHIRQLAAIGLESRISEMDVYIEDGQAVQAQQYSSVLQTCLEEPSCTSFTTWGVSDRYDMFRDDDGSLQFGQDFLWDSNMRPTPAVESLRRVLQL